MPTLVNQKSHSGLHPLELVHRGFVPNEAAAQNPNAVCYDALAHEYADSSHKTCREFDIYGEKFFKDYVRPLARKDYLMYLEYGPGTGNCMNWLEDEMYLPDARHKRYVEVVDISFNMGFETYREHGFLVNKYNICKAQEYSSENRYDLIVASMCDPYLDQDFLDNSSTLLFDKTSRLVLTYPHKDWADSIRKEQKHETVFRDLNGNMYKSSSSCLLRDDLLEMANEASLELKTEKTYSHGKYKNFFNGFMFGLK